ncbi:MAG: FG-GAP-like repeat-containing protein [Pyrinomonadaceae bacterium]
MNKTSLVKFFVLTLLVMSFSTICLSQKLRLRSQATPTCTSVTTPATWKFSDIYADGNIAVMGSYNCRGVFIYDVSNPDAPVLSSWYNPTPNLQFLEAIVIGNRGYFGAGGGTDGVHIVDLTNPSNPVLLGKVNSTIGGGYNTIHEMMVFDHSGSRYLLENSNSTGNRNLRIINVTNPAAPTLKWEFLSSDGGWVHAMHIRGNRLFLSGFTSSSRIDIYDMTNLATQTPVLLGSVMVGNDRNHSAWTNETGEYIYSARELSNGDLRVFDIRNPAQPLLIRSIQAAGLNINAISPHNPVVMGNTLYISWYQAGVQVFDITDPTNPIRQAQYDTYQPEFAPSEEETKLLENAEPWDIFCGSNSFGGNALPGTYGGNWAVFPFLGANKVLAGDLNAGLVVLDASAISAPSKNKVSDFDGDGKTDLSVFRSSNGNWDIEQSSNGAPSTINFGLSGDVITPGDFDGDGVNDLAIYRPSTGTWWIRRSSNPNNFLAVQFGLSADIPMAADYDADGKTDIAVWRQSTGVWYILQSTLGIRITQWGISTDKPVRGDFEGDGKADIAVWRPSNGVWYILQSSSSIPMYGQWGINGDKALSADFDGNGITDLAVYRPSNGVWYVYNPATGTNFGAQWGIAEDIPIPADFDGDAKADIAVFRPSTNVWYRINSSNGSVDIRAFGATGDVPSPSSVQPQ